MCRTTSQHPPLHQQVSRAVSRLLRDSSSRRSYLLPRRPRKCSSIEGVASGFPTMLPHSQLSARAAKASTAGCHPGSPAAWRCKHKGPVSARLLAHVLQHPQQSGPVSLPTFLREHSSENECSHDSQRQVRPPPHEAMSVWAHRRRATCSTIACQCATSASRHADASFILASSRTLPDTLGNHQEYSRCLPPCPRTRSHSAWRGLRRLQSACRWTKV